MTIDDTRLRGLLEQSGDLHTDAMLTTRVELDEFVELAHEDPWRDVDAATRRTTLLRGLPKSGVLAAAGLGTAMAALLASPAFADKTMDVQMLQTAASIENLAITAYGLSLSLPFIGGSDANPVVKTFVTTTAQQHKDHLQAFNSAQPTNGGQVQNAPDPVLLGVVNEATPGLTGPGPVLALAIQLETGAAETYVAYVSALSDINARKVTASIMGVEAQHVTVLLAAQEVIAGGNVEQLTLPPPLEKLSGSVASAAVPDAFFKTDQARPAGEGAVQ